MSFYGKGSNITETHFQFDKIYNNRREMDEDLAAGTDNIFVGRFVLVEYGANERDDWPGVQVGYRVPDADYIMFTQDAAGHVLFQYSNDVDNSNLPNITDGQIIQEREGGTLTGNFYICEGSEPGHNSDPHWSFLTNKNNYGGYSHLINYAIDHEYYKNFDPKGYNATCWQKIYTEGKGGFIQIARFECLPPEIDLVQDAPSVYPTAPYIGKNSSDNEVYQIHVPTHWGFQIREVKEDGEGEAPSEDDSSGYNKSDQLIKRDQLVKKEYLPSDSETYYNADIYMNLGGTNKEIQQNYHYLSSNRDDVTPNEILITQTGYSGEKYGGADLVPDVLELSVHLPVIGNMIDDGYDLIYGKNEDSSRPKDIEWYGSDVNEQIKINGAAGFNGKTYDLKTLAGTLNEMHRKLGQNINYNYAQKPNKEIVSSQWSDDEIYYVEDLDTYYRKGIKCDLTELEDDFFTYRYIGHIPEQEYIANTYYYTTDPIPSGKVDFQYNELHFFPAIGDFEDKEYFIKNITDNVYHRKNLTYYTPNTYYYKRGQDYILDTNENEPIDLSYTYCTIADKDKVGPYMFYQAYIPNDKYYTSDGKGNYLLATEAFPNQAQYYEIASTALNIYASRIYQPNKYWYKTEDGTLALDTRENLTTNDTEAFHHYVLNFSPEKEWALDENGQMIQIQRQVGEPQDVYLIKIPNVEEMYYIRDAANNFISILNVEDLYAARIYYTLSINAMDPTKFFLPGQYYYEEGENLILANIFDQNREYFQIAKVDYLEYPFYVPNQYYYNAGGDFYYLDTAVSTEHRPHYTKDELYVIKDETLRCEKGYQWNSLSVFVPASITLGYRVEYTDAIPMRGLVDGTPSINGILLKLDQIYNIEDNEYSRDLNTLTGALKSVQDLFYTIKHLVPGQILYVNEFGQITSMFTGPSSERRIFTIKEDGQLDVITLSELKTLLDEI